MDAKTSDIKRESKPAVANAKNEPAKEKAESTPLASGQVKSVASHLHAVPSSAKSSERGSAAAARKPSPSKGRTMPEVVVVPEMDASVQHAINKSKRARKRLVMLSLLAVVALPTLIASIYYFGIAADQYVVETRFAVRGNDQSQIGGLLGLLSPDSSSATMGDSYILQQFIASQDLVSRLEKTVDLRQVYTSDRADFWARYGGEDTPERFLPYWQQMVTAMFDRFTGVMTLKVRAFTPEDSLSIAKLVVRECTLMVNELSEQALNDTVNFARKEVSATEERLNQARRAIAEFRTDESVIDPHAVASAHEQLLASLDAKLLAAKAELGAMGKFVSSDSPQRRVLQSKIDALASQVAAIKDRARTGGGEASGSPGDNDPLSDKLAAFEALQTEQEFAQKAYVSAMTGLEAARAKAAQNQRYLAVFVNPVLPREAALPMRSLNVLIVFLASLIVWAISSLLYAAVRDHTV